MPARAKADQVDVFVEIPRGSRAKYELDKKSGRIRLDRVLHSSVHYPADYGFVMDTLGNDGDPLDAVVIVEEPTFPGCVVPARPIGTLFMRDSKGEDEKSKNGLASLLKAMHKGTAHVGKAPSRLMRTLQYDAQLKTLRQDLQRAVDEENYEAAAQLRDQIKQIETTTRTVT